MLVIGTINAWNFMDGINGITGSYSLVTIMSLYFINETTDPEEAPFENPGFNATVFPHSEEKEHDA